MVGLSAIVCTCFGMFIVLRYRALCVPFMKAAGIALCSALPGLVLVSLATHAPQWGALYAEIAEGVAAVLVIVTFFNGERNLILAPSAAEIAAQGLPARPGQLNAKLMSMGGVFCVFVSIALVIAHAGNYAAMLGLTIAGLALILVARRMRSG